MENKIYKNVQEAVKKLNSPFVYGFMLVDKNAKLPKCAHDTDAGFDLYSVENCVIPAHKYIVIDTGLRWEPYNLYDELQIRPRSGMAAKSGITVLNSPGTIDGTYRGNICVILINHSDTDYKISIGDRIAQAVIPRYHEKYIVQVEEISETIRGDKKFGSSGI